MPYLIDGHNLIGRMRAISLSDPDDEARLVALLAAWCDRRATSATVYFDRGAPAAGGARRQGRVTVRFVRPPGTADGAIRGQLRRIGRTASNWTVVSSDREVTAAARRAGARCLQSETFAAELQTRSPGPAPEKPEGSSSEEVASWLREFRKGRGSP